MLVAQWCPTLCNSMDCSPPGSSVHGILQVRILEWVASPFSRGFSWPRDQIRMSCINRQVLLPSEPPGSPYILPYYHLVILPYYHIPFLGYLSSVRSLSHVQLFVTPWTAAGQASLSITNSWSLRKLMSIALVMPSNHLILCRPLLLLPSIFPSIRVFSNESVLNIMWPNIRVSASTSVLPVSIQDWFPLGLTCLISLQSKGLSRVFSNTTVQKHQFFAIQLSL